MEVYFLRHGVATTRGDPRYPTDAERPLTKKGCKKLEAQVAGLKRFDVKPGLIITSPLVRARQTAELVAQGLGLSDRVLVNETLAAGCTVDDILDLLATYPDQTQVMLVGHEPDFSQAAALLSGGSGDIWLRKGGLIRLDIDSLAGRRGVLRWLLEPEHLMLQTT